MDIAVTPPVGVVGLLFTDIEGSTRLARSLGGVWNEVLERHHQIVGRAIVEQGGWVDADEGDAFFATFVDPERAADAAVAAQRGLRSAAWPKDLGELRVRMGLHVGLVERTEIGYVGLEIHRAARVAAAAHGGQLLLTEAARVTVGDGFVVDDLGLHRLKDFPTPERLYCAVIDGRGADSFPPPRTLRVRPTNLPDDRPRLIGRDREARQLRAMLRTEDGRLVTVTGRGGCGKTSLALAVAAELLDEYPGGVWWVPLATIRGAAQVLPQIAKQIGADPGGRMPVLEALAARVQGSPVLLVLDNMEHLLAAGADIAALLEQAPGLRVLDTSQVRVGLARERVFVLESLAPSDALRLFRARGKMVRPRLRLAGDDLDAAREICRRLDGLPLAVELAAARLGVLSPRQLQDRLVGSLDLLTGKTPGGLERHRSLRATVQWSLGLLDSNARSLFTALGVFASAASAEDIEAVAGQAGTSTVDAVSALREVALLRDLEEGDGVLRFELPEALRQVAVEELAASPDAAHWRRAHAQRVLAVLLPARMHLSAPAAAYPAAVRLDADATLAYHWARQHAPDLGCELAAAWCMRLTLEGHFRAADPLIEDVLSAPDVPAGPQARALFAAAMAARSRGDPATAARLFDAALTQGERGDRELVPVILAARGRMYGYLGELEAAIRDCTRATQLAEEFGPAVVAGSLISESQVYTQAGLLDDAERTLVEATELCGSHSVWASDWLDTHWGDLELARGHYEPARTHYLRSIIQAEKVRDDLQIINDLASMCQALVGAGRIEDAAEMLALAKCHGAHAFGSSAWVDTLVKSAGSGPHVIDVETALLSLDPAVVRAIQARATSTPPEDRVARARAIAGRPASG